LAKPLNIKDPEAYQLAREIADQTGKSLTRVVVDALRQERNRMLPRSVDMGKVQEILARVDALPVIDAKSPDEILKGLYDDAGMWK
jgi:antitoxin VapB